MRLINFPFPKRLLNHRAFVWMALWASIVLGITVEAISQDPRPKQYFPLNKPLPKPGLAGDWAGRIGKASPVRFQLVQIHLPGEGEVTWFEGGPDRVVTQPAPASAGLLVGYVYRFKISGLVDQPGVELYPTIELVDRLHPPLGREAEFPIAVEFSEREIAFAQEGRLVTKVIYLEQPNRAALAAVKKNKPLQAIEVGPRENPIEIADENGRPLAIVRLGGRLPDVTRPEPGFFGSGAPLNFSVKAVAPEEVVEKETVEKKPVPEMKEE